MFIGTRCICMLNCQRLRYRSRNYHTWPWRRWEMETLAHHQWQHQIFWRGHRGKTVRFWGGKSTNLPKMSDLCNLFFCLGESGGTEPPTGGGVNAPMPSWLTRSITSQFIKSISCYLLWLFVYFFFILGPYSGVKFKYPPVLPYSPVTKYSIKFTLPI